MLPGRRRCRAASCWIDHDSRRVVCGRTLASQDPHPVGGQAVRAVRARDGLQPGWIAARHRETEVIDDARSRSTPPAAVGRAPVEAAQAGAVRDDLHVGRVAPAQQPRVGGIGAACPAAAVSATPPMSPVSSASPSLVRQRCRSHRAENERDGMSWPLLGPERDGGPDPGRGAAGPGGDERGQRHGHRDGGQYQRDGHGSGRRDTRRAGEDGPRHTVRPGCPAAPRTAARSRPARPPATPPR